MLTKKQKELYDFLCDKIGKSGITPSFEEMKQHLGLGSKSGVHRLIEALDARGFISRLHYRHRAIYILPSWRRWIFHQFRPSYRSELVLARKVVSASGLLKTRYHDHKLTISPESYKALKIALKEYHGS